MPYQDILKDNWFHNPEPYVDPLQMALMSTGLGPAHTGQNIPPYYTPQPPMRDSQFTMDMERDMYLNRMRRNHPHMNPETPPGDTRSPVQDLPGIPNLPSQGMPQLPPLQGQFNNPGNNAMPAGSMQSPFPGGNQPMARPSGRPKLPDPPQPPRQQQGTPPQRGPFGQTFGERQY